MYFIELTRLTAKHYVKYFVRETQFCSSICVILVLVNYAIHKSHHLTIIKDDFIFLTSYSSIQYQLPNIDEY